ncbi:MAG TPA: hypothetical protein VML95_05525 [Longimicrobiales bacterium]|nr:hypothetical protein [Longimicrobiales bacterium]
MTDDSPRDDDRDEYAPDPLPPHAEPVVTGTVFIMLLFLMALAGLWGIMYLLLLGR